MTEVMKESYSKEEVQQMIKEAQQSQARWVYLDLAFRECLNHMRPLCTPSKEYPIPTYDPQVYAELDHLFTQVRNQYLGIEPEPEPVPEEPDTLK
jgi:hypothetical protein